MAVTDDQLRRLQRFLDPGETIVWAGQPNAARALRSALPILFFAVPWTAFSLFWTAMAGGAAWFTAKAAGPPGLLGVAFPLFGLPFILIGLGMLATPYWAWRSAQKTVYVVTNRRALVGTPSDDGYAVKDYAGADLADLADLNLTVRNDGSGTIDFAAVQARQTVRDSDGDKQTLGKGLRPHTFADIPDVERVYDLLRALARSAPAAPLGDAPSTGDGFALPTGDGFATAFGSAFASDFAEEARRNAPGWKSGTSA